MQCKFLNAAGIPEMPSKWLRIYDIDPIPNYSDVTPSKVDLSTEIFGERFPTPFIYQIFSIEQQKSIMDLKGLFVFSTSSLPFKDLVESAQRQYTANGIIGIEITATDKLDLIDILVNEHKITNLYVFVVPPANFNTLDNLAVTKQIRDIKLKFGSYPNIKVAAGYPTNYISMSAWIDAGVDAILINNTKHDATTLLHAMSAITNKAKNIGIIYNGGSSPDIASIALGADSFIFSFLHKEDVDKAISDLRNRFVECGISNFRDCFETLHLKVV